ncbi:MAG: hypothetical protein AAFY15_13935 [Cyanobacteria bacterium J06648_11]
MRRAIANGATPFVFLALSYLSYCSQSRMGREISAWMILQPPRDRPHPRSLSSIKAIGLELKLLTLKMAILRAFQA